MQLADGFKNQVQARVVSSRQQFERDSKSTPHPVTISEAAMNEFDKKWASVELRMKIVPGKEVFSALNAHLQSKYKIALNTNLRCRIVPARRNQPCRLQSSCVNWKVIRKEDAPDQAALEFSPASPD